MIRPVALPVIVALALSLQLGGAEASARRGQALAKEQCARCHSIGRTGKSSLEKAPPLRTIPTKYKLETLEEAFAEGIVVSHDSPEMPAFEMEPQQISDLIDYLRTLRRKK